MTPGGVEEAVIYPSLSEQPLYRFRRDPTRHQENLVDYVTASLPNAFLAALPVSAAEAGGIGREVATAIRTEWVTIASRCWEGFARAGLVRDQAKGRFDRQVRRLLFVSWQATPLSSDYRASREENARQLDAVRRTRDFRAWGTGGWSVGQEHNKDSLTGREEAVCGGEKWWRASGVGKGVWKHLFPEKQAGEHFGAITLVKRVWHHTYLGAPPWNRRIMEILRTPSTWQVAAHVPDKEEADDTEETANAGHFAVLAMDGDHMGRWLSNASEPKAQQAFSSRLGGFARSHARSVVRKHDGFLVYAGGDDVVAMVPGDSALDCAKELRARFRKAVGEPGPDASAGVAVAHPKTALQDVVREAQGAEKRAKNELGRSAVAVTLLKRSGGITGWGCKWDEGGLELYEALVRALEKKELSSKAPYRLVELLAPYVSQSAPLLKELERIRDDKGFAEVVDKIIRREFETVLDRQGDYTGTEDARRAELISLLGKYVGHLSKGVQSKFVGAAGVCDRKGDGEAWAEGLQSKLGGVIGLCDTAAFANRTASTDSPPTEGRPA